MQKVINHIKENLSTQILIALVLGVIAGLFWGEMASSLNFIGDAFVRLFQMPVIPYIVVSLISSIGRLNYEEAKSIFLKGGAIMLGLWGIILAVVIIFPLGFPAWKSASFFSTSLLEPEKSLDLLALFIPLNPFTAMANTIIPSVVLFSIALGFALIPYQNKQLVVDVFSGLENGLMRITQFVAKLTPYGVFAIIASSAGTLPLEAFKRLGVYIVIQALISLVLSIWFLPGLVALITPLKYWDIIKAFRSPLLIAFATANLVIALPLIIARSRELLSSLDESLTPDSPEIASPPQVLVPASYVFPDMGRLISLSFIPFAAWFGGSSLPFSQYPGFLLAGLASFFGDGLTAMRFLLNLMGIPSDMIQIYITLDQVSVARFGTLLAGMNAVILALLGTCAINGWVRFPRPRIVRFSIISTLAILFTLGSVHLFFTYGTTNTYTKDKLLANLELLRVRNAQSSQVFQTPPPPLPIEPTKSRLEQIEERGILRVCYQPKSYPLSYFNQKGELVGLDVEMAHLFASTLGVKLEFVPLSEGFKETLEMIEQGLKEGYCDVIGTAIPITPESAKIFYLSAPVLNYTLGFLVEDRYKNKFSNWQSLQKMDSLQFGFSGRVPYYENKIKGLLPQANIVQIDTIRQTLEDKESNLDAIIYTAESGAAWTLLYPDYSIAVPQPVVSVPIAYAVPHGEQELLNIFNAWLQLKQQDETIKSLFDYWVQGKVEQVQPPRWSIIRNVLHWVQ
ncbi:MAG: cation:dicarboxylase symporter family transporter [Xenococcaceae cyanobacterium]